MASSEEEAKARLISTNPGLLLELLTQIDAGVGVDRAEAVLGFSVLNHKEEILKTVMYLILVNEGSLHYTEILMNLFHDIVLDLLSRTVSSEMNQELLKSTLLVVLRRRMTQEVTRKMWNLVTILFKKKHKSMSWPEIIKLFSDSLDSPLFYVKDLAVQFILECPECLKQVLSQHLNNLRLSLGRIFVSSSGQRKLNALAALIDLVLSTSNDYYHLFCDLPILIVQEVPRFLYDDILEDNGRAVLMKLEEFIVDVPRFFDLHLNRVFKVILQVAVNDQLERRTRFFAMKILYAFDDNALQTVNKMVLGQVFDLLISAIPDISFGESFLRRIIVFFGSEVEKFLLLKTVSEDMASADWRKRYAAVTIIGVIAQGYPQAIRDNLAAVMNVIRNLMNDPSPFVLFAVVGTVESLSRHLPLRTLDLQANDLITWLLAFEGGNKPAKQVAAVSAIRYLCERCSSPIIKQHRLETIVKRLLELLHSKYAEVQSESLSTLKSLAKSSKDLFCQGYDFIMRSLKMHLAGAKTKSLQVNYIECICTVGTAGGKDLFTKDAAEVVALLLSVRWYLGEDDYSFKAILLQAWEQLFILLGSHFCPYMKYLLPDLLRSARLGSNSVTGSVFLMEKFKACKLLLRLTEEFKRELFPWIDQISDLLVSLVKFHDGDIRKIAFSVMPKLLLSAKLSIEEKQAHGFTNTYLHKLVLQFVLPLVEALDEETDAEVCAKLLESLTKCIEIAGGFLSKKKIQRTANAIEELLKAISRKHFSQEEALTDLEKRIIEKVVHYIRILMEIYGESSKPLVNKFLETLRGLVRNDPTAKEKEIALLIKSLKCDEAALRL